MTPFGLGGFGMDITLFHILFFLVAAIIVVQLVRSLIGWQRNNRSPILSVPARIVSTKGKLIPSMSEKEIPYWMMWNSLPIIRK